MIEVKIVADSLNSATGDRLTTFLLTYPRYIHAEIMTHRMFSRNAASSRAIPVKKFRKDVMDNPVIPSHWGINQKGMQADEELDDVEKCMIWWPEVPDVDGSSLPASAVTKREWAKRKWLAARDKMLKVHEDFETLGLHKQLSNRCLETWFHIQLLVSATRYENFFSLRCHKDAHPDIQGLADAMLYQYVHNQPTIKIPGEWHLPFGDQFLNEVRVDDRVKVCVARAARLSYKNFEQVINVKDDIELHDRLMASGHWSPFEHPAKALPHSTWSGNYRGWWQYRKQFPDEDRQLNLHDLWMKRSRTGTVYAKGPVTTSG